MIEGIVIEEEEAKVVVDLAAVIGEIVEIEIGTAGEAAKEAEALASALLSTVVAVVEV